MRSSVRARSGCAKSVADFILALPKIRFEDGERREPLRGRFQRLDEAVRGGEAVARRAGSQARRSVLHGLVPYFLCASARPRTVPGTPERASHRYCPGWLALRIEIHVARRFFGRFFAEIDKSGPAVGEAGEQESTAAEIPGDWIRDGECERDGDRGVHSIAAGFENRCADIGRQRLFRDHHPVSRAHRMARPAESAKHENASRTASARVTNLSYRHAPFPLEQNDACRDGDIERRNRACHRDPHEDIAVLPHELVQAFALAAQHDDRGRGVLNVS